MTASKTEYLGIPSRAALEKELGIADLPQKEREILLFDLEQTLELLIEEAVLAELSEEDRTRYRDLLENGTDQDAVAFITPFIAANKEKVEGVVEQVLAEFREEAGRT